MIYSHYPGSLIGQRRIVNHQWNDRSGESYYQDLEAQRAVDEFAAEAPVAPTQNLAQAPPEVAVTTNVTFEGEEAHDSRGTTNSITSPTPEETSFAPTQNLAQEAPPEVAVATNVTLEGEEAQREETAAAQESIGTSNSIANPTPPNVEEETTNSVASPTNLNIDSAPPTTVTLQDQSSDETGHSDDEDEDAYTLIQVFDPKKQPATKCCHDDCPYDAVCAWKNVGDDSIYPSCGVCMT